MNTVLRIDKELQLGLKLADKQTYGQTDRQTNNILLLFDSVSEQKKEKENRLFDCSMIIML